MASRVSKTNSSKPNRGSGNGAGQEITFLIPGQLQTGASAATRGGLAGPDVAPSTGRIKASVRLSTGTARDAADAGSLVRVSAKPGEDVVVLTIAGGPTLVLHPEDARDLMRAQTAGQGSTGTRGATVALGADEVAVSGNLAWAGLEATATRGATRGWLGDVVLQAFDVVTDLFKDEAVTLVTAAITKKVDGQVDAGVYDLKPFAQALPATLKGSGAKLAQVPPAADGQPLLVLVHGTFVDTVSTFGKLWLQHPDKVRDLFSSYGDKVYALDHPTMGLSPIANALTLVEALPAGARLHLVTHSRGGLVAEILARACGGGKLTLAELALFADEKYAQHRKDLTALVQQAQAKGIKLERVVRVACPARGTTLASGRLDAYLSVLQWGLQLAQVPVAPALVDFLHEVARRRADPAELPGIEAMMPESAVVAWLNRAEIALPGELRVVAGDLEGDSIGSWVKTLLADAFYWGDNDLVVQTRSMYGGAPRQGELRASASPSAQFMLDRGGKVTHFNYFSNASTVDAITGALLSSEPAGFAAIGPLSWAGESASGTRSARAVARSRGLFWGNDDKPAAHSAEELAQAAQQAAKRPAVFVLPGILGSNLKLDGKRIWLGFGFVNGLMKLAWDPATADRVQPDGPIGSSYDDLIERLADSHEVIPFAYDWRRPIEDEARRLAVELDKAIAARRASGQPVRIIAHSMGGLVARTVQLEAPETWRRLMAHAEARVLMLGTPNGGSWAPMQTLSGDDTFGNALVAFGSLFNNGGARKMMAGMPGFIQLQADLLDPAQGLDKAETWQKLADQDINTLRQNSYWHTLDSQITIYEWGAPPQAVLDQAVRLRRRLDAQLATLGTDKQKMLLVVGHADFTPAGIQMDPLSGLEYLNTPDDGDGRVTQASSTQLGLRTWKLDAEHGKLPDVAEAFAAYIELLSSGDTRLLDRLELNSRGAASLGKAGPSASRALQRSRPSRGLLSSLPPSRASDVLASAGAAKRGQGKLRANTAQALQVRVLNADLRFVQQPLLVGHYRALSLTGAEGVIDGLVQQGMSRALAAGLYPDAPGSHQIFGNERSNPDNPFEMARPQAVIVVGLGEEGKLRASDLSFTVRQAVLAYAQRLSEQRGQGGEGKPQDFEMAATLIGSGGSGITAGSAARAIAQGALEAKQKLQACGWHQLRQLTLVELFLDRAGDAWRALQLQELAAPERLRLQGKVESGPGAMRRMLESSYRGASYDFISALSVPGQDPAHPVINYTLDTKRARTEIRAQHAQGSLLRELVEKASNVANTDPMIGRTLFNLLVPVEMEPFLGGTSEMVIELEAATAGIPWELLNTNPDPGVDDQRPWAIRSKLIRKLQLKDFRSQVRDASPDDHVLVIGEPLCDPTKYPRLDGARREALAVASQLGMALGDRDGNGEDKVRQLVEQNDAQSIINALFERNYRAVHIAGHGAPSAKGGVVLSGTDTYLGADEVRAMRVVPELVFLNCCHLAGREAASVLSSQGGSTPTYDRASFAANIAEELIRVGVRCVVAAGWAVEDEAAEQFATRFYAALLSGARFIEAVGQAREAAWHANPQGNTWAAYQCYGDPEWRWQREGGDAQRPTVNLGEEFAGIASPVSLTLALEKIAVEAQYSKSKASSTQLDKLRYLDAQFKALWGGMGAVAEAFAVAYTALGERATAITWYRIAVNAEDASASLKAAEQLGNLLVRQGEKTQDQAALEEGTALLERILAMQPTAERHNLLGSAWKLQAMTKAAGQGREDLQRSLQHYLEAERICVAQGDPKRYYPAMNAIALSLHLAFQDPKLQSLQGLIAPQRIQDAREALSQANQREPDFWSVVGQTELNLLEALSQGRLAGVADACLASFAQLKQRVPAATMWDSVAKQARFTLQPYLSCKLGTAAQQRAEHGAAQRILDGLAALGSKPFAA
ncbi:hypothetical protein DBR47_00300 [Paucibacter sp. KBW04]|uniref:DUF7379 domain-containing protein n=1 Tax=Paucibacter sp. KBW04 TaxID=2153361 RepID=UPI000F567E72|nr:CHAT domain-containing protein [Paucibacter sp. KBW04]RQO63053.1 hypothetical protein DBR47_00300 [Paucibacter sp. KBW04]